MYSNTISNQKEVGFGPLKQTIMLSKLIFLIDILKEKEDQRKGLHYNVHPPNSPKKN